MKLWISVLVLIPVSCLGQYHHRQSRGIFDQAEKVWDRLHVGFDQFQASARNDFDRFRPIAEQVEDQVRPAVESLHGVFNSMTDQLFGGGGLERVGQDGGQHMQTFFDRFHQEPIDPFRIFGLSRKRWWEGDHVCVERNVLDEAEEKEADEETETFHSFIDMAMTSCRDGEEFHECTTNVNTNGRKKTIVVKHQCCYGFVRAQEGIGCVETDLKSLKETVQDFDDSQEFIQLMETLGLDNVLEDNVTLFLPTDEAVEDYRHDLEKSNSLEQISYNVDDALVVVNKRRKRQEMVEVFETPSLVDVVKNHVVKGFVDSADMHDEVMLSTINDEGSEVRITEYNTHPERTMMANCARVTGINYYATNGVVHTIDKVIVPAIKTIAEVIESDSKFTKLAQVLRNSDLMHSLDTRKGQFTLFAPSDEAFEALDEMTKTKIEGANGCSQDILKHHLLPNVICSGVVEDKAKTVNALNKLVLLERDEEGALYVEEAKVTMTDIMAINGVIHVIDKVIIPESARSVEDALEDRSKLKELFDLAEFSDLSNKTIFAPSERALSDLPSEYLDSLKSDKEKLREFLGYHVVTPKTCQCDFENNKVMQTEVEDKKLRLNVYDGGLNLFEIVPRKTSTVQCARITRLDDEVCGGMIHTVDKVLLPPGGNTIEVMKNSGKFTKFMELIEFSELENELVSDDAVTILAPTDTAFEKLDEKVKDKMFSDKDVAARVLQTHVINDMICCAGIPKHVPFLDVSGRRTQSGEVISLRKSQGGHIYADRSEVTTCDMVATDGVVHAIDRVLVPEDLVEDITGRSSRKSSSPRLVFKLFK